MTENSLMDDMQDDGFRFTHDLITEVIKRKGINVPYVNFPNPRNFLFTNAHRIRIEEFLALNGEYIENLVINYAKRFPDTRSGFSNNNYFENCPTVMKNFTPEPYTEGGFVCLCAAVAQLAACIFLRNAESDVLVYAMDQLHNLVKIVLSNGTLQQSSMKAVEL